VPWVATGNGLVVVICTGTVAAAIDRLNVTTDVCGVEQESVAVICGLNAPEVLGVPEIRPLLDTLTPVGNAPPVSA